MMLFEFLPRLEARERRRFYLAAVAFMCAAASALVARAAGDALFLSSFGSGPLPFLYVGGAVATGLGAYGCARAARNLSTARIAIIVGSLLVVANLTVVLILDVAPGVSRTSAYLLADIAARIPILLFWALASEIFDAQESRRLFGLLGAAGTAACLPAGFLVGPVARYLGMRSLIVLVGGLMAGFILAVRALERQQRRELASKDRTLVATNMRSASQLHWKSQFLAIAALAAVTSLVQTHVDYQFKATFTAVESGAALAAIFGGLYAYANLAALFLQLVVVHRFLRWGGVWFSLCALPVSLLAASTGILRTASTNWVYATKALDVTMTLTVTGAARQLLYRGIPPESRLQARALAEGIYQPLAVAFAGCLLFLVADSLTLRLGAAITIAACLMWILVARRAYTTYISGLLRSFRARLFAPDDQPFTPSEPAVEAYVRNALASAPNEEVVYLAAVLPQLGDFGGTPELRSALARGDSRAKVAIIDYLLEHGAPADLEPVRALVADVEPEVRRAVVRAVMAAEPPVEEGWLRERLTDVDPGVRAAAAAGLINTGLDSGVTDGVATLREMVLSASADDRRAAAEGLDDVQLESVTALLERLLDSREPEVLESTLAACQSHPDPTLLGAILPLLASKRLGAGAADALVAMGPAAAESVIASLRVSESVQRPVLAITNLAGALARSGDAAALPLLDRMLMLVGVEDQAVVFQAGADLIKRQHSSQPFLRDVEARICAEAQAAKARAAEARSLGSSAATELLRVVLTDQVGCHLRHAFILLDVRFERIDMKSLHSAFTRGTKESRSQVVEFLDNVLPRRLREPLLGALAQDDLEPAEAPADLPSIVAGKLERSASESVSDWVIAGALLAASRIDLRSSCDRVRRLLAHTNPVVRETALAALERLDDRPRFLETCSALTADTDETVRALAIRLGGAKRSSADTTC